MISCIDLSEIVGEKLPKVSKKLPKVSQKVAKNVHSLNTNKLKD